MHVRTECFKLKGGKYFWSKNSKKMGKNWNKIVSQISNENNKNERKGRWRDFKLKFDPNFDDDFFIFYFFIPAIVILLWRTLD